MFSLSRKKILEKVSEELKISTRELPKYSIDSLN